jgi:hypothetical protein
MPRRGTWDALDFCVAFDQAAYLDDRQLPAGVSAREGYFVDRHDSAAHLYIARISSMDAIGRRLDYIRSRAGPAPDAALRTPTERVLHGIAKRGLKLIRSARDVLGAGDPEQSEPVRRARDF